MYKLIISDLDGTLLNDKGELTLNTREYLYELYKMKGIHIVPCSGRPLEEIPSWFKNNEIVPFVISANGARIVDNYMKIIVQHTISKDICKEIMEVIEEARLSYTIIRDGMAIKCDWSSNCILEGRIEKVHFRFDSIELKNYIRKKLRKIGDIVVTSSDPHNLEISSIAASKGKAAKCVMGLMNCNKYQVLAFGDNENDISLMDNLEETFALKNADEKLIKKCKYLTEKDNNNEGVISEIRLFLNKMGI